MAKNIKTLYKQLIEKLDEIYVIKEIAGLVGWDTHVMMPKKGITQRSKQQSYLAALIHKKQTTPELGVLIDEILSHSEYENLRPLEKRNILKTQKSYDKSTKVPEHIVQEMADICSKATLIWEEAKKNSDYKSFMPSLEKIVSLSKKRAEYIDPDARNIYDTFLDDFESQFTLETYNALFKDLKQGLIDLTRKITTSPHQPDMSLIRRECPLDVQTDLSKNIIPILGFDLNAGRLDTSAHPFTQGAMDDVRITSRFKPDSFATNFFAVMHEAGHAIYEQNLPRETFHQPVGDAPSFGWHESQSRFYENIIGRSEPFWQYYYPSFQNVTRGIFSDVQLEPFLHAINYVHQSTNRVEADEVTYGLHVILRYEIEQDLFMEKVKVSELKDLWNAKMKSYLNIDITDDAEGILQDFHWSQGYFGYFPSYLLGNLYGLQLLKLSLEKEMPDWQKRVNKGDIASIKTWLTKNIYQKGNLYEPLEMVKTITHAPLSPEYFLNYLTEKYSKLYKL